MRKKIDESRPTFGRTVLNDGVRIVTEHIPSVRSVAVGVWVFTGSRDESADERGISHFIEHMVFKGTRRRRMHHIAARMESVGGYLNAFTSKEYTCYYARALDEHLARAVDTVCDLVLDPHFPEAELEKEKGVVLEEMKMYEDAPEDLVFDRFEDVLYQGHAMAAPVLGYPETVQAFDRDQLLDYMNRHYTPDRVVLAAAGNVSHEQVVRLAQKAFASSKRRPRRRSRAPVPAYEPTRRTEHRPIQQAHLVVGTRGLDVYDDRRSALSVLNTILGGGMSSRLNQNIRERYGYCYSIYSFKNQHSDTGDVGVYMGTDAAHVERARELIWREMARLRDDLAGERVLSRAKNQLKGAAMLGLESMSNRMMRLGRQELYYERYFTLDEEAARIDAVTAEDVRDVARLLFDRDRLSTVALLPQNDADGPYRDDVSGQSAGS